MTKKKWILALCLCAVAAILIWDFGAVRLPKIRADIREESRVAIRDTVIRSAVECYAVEGAYPSGLAYLEENYGLSVNHDEYIVIYDVFASNVLPNVQVLVRGEG